MKKEIRSETVDDFVNSSTTSCPKSRLYCGDTLCHRFRPLYHKFDHLTYHSHLFKVRSPDTLCHRFRPVYHKFHHLDHHSHLFKVRSPLSSGSLCFVCEHMLIRVRAQRCLLAPLTQCSNDYEQPHSRLHARIRMEPQLEQTLLHGQIEISHGCK